MLALARCAGGNSAGTYGRRLLLSMHGLLGRRPTTSKIHKSNNLEPGMMLDPKILSLDVLEPDRPRNAEVSEAFPLGWGAGEKKE